MKRLPEVYSYWFDCYARFNGNTINQQLHLDADDLPFMTWIEKHSKIFDKETDCDSVIDSSKFDNYLAQISFNGPMLYVQNNSIKKLKERK